MDKQYQQHSLLLI